MCSWNSLVFCRQKSHADTVIKNNFVRVLWIVWWKNGTEKNIFEITHKHVQNVISIICSEKSHFSLRKRRGYKEQTYVYYNIVQIRMEYEMKPKILFCFFLFGDYIIYIIKRTQWNIYYRMFDHCVIEYKHVY